MSLSRLFLTICPILLLSIILHGCIEEIPVKGCTCPTATNFNASAEEDDGSCSGCMNENAENFTSCAVIDDGSCSISGCTDPSSVAYDDNANVDDGSCTYLPEVTIGTAVDVTHAQFTIDGQIVDMGNDIISNSGFVVGDKPNPDLSSATIVEVSSITEENKFTQRITVGLRATKYYVKAFVSNTSGVGYSDELEITTDSKIHDADGNTYNVVSIKGQNWLDRNLISTKLRSGTKIAHITKEEDWGNSTSPEFAFYEYNEEVYLKYGALYNLYAAENEEICPFGWHVPTEGEFLSLGENLGGLSIAGNELKEEGTNNWNESSGATDTFGFTALPTGYLRRNGSSTSVYYLTYFWAKADENTELGDTPWASLSSSSSVLTVHETSLNFGQSIRCIED